MLNDKNTGNWCCHVGCGLFSQCLRLVVEGKTNCLSTDCGLWPQRIKVRKNSGLYTRTDVRRNDRRIIVR